MIKVKLKKNDEVKVIAGKDKGKTGRILKVFPAQSKAIVEGINKVKRHRKPSQKDQHGGIKDEERAIELSNLMLICPQTKKVSRLGVKELENGERARFCKKSDVVLDR